MPQIISISCYKHILKCDSIQLELESGYNFVFNLFLFKETVLTNVMSSCLENIPLCLTNEQNKLSFLLTLSQVGEIGLPKLRQILTDRYRFQLHKWTHSGQESYIKTLVTLITSINYYSRTWIGAVKYCSQHFHVVALFQ